MPKKQADSTSILLSGDEFFATLSMISDEQCMRRALDLARAGFGLASPNPVVGAVVLDANGDEVGAGTHTYDGVKHAEILALEQARERARGGTLAINLEPCSHQGRTGPCADAVIAAGIKRIVCAMQDPNPRVAGNGFAKLRAAGVTVDIGVLQHEAKKLNEAFAKFIRHGKPLVTLKSALTLDGKIAPPAKTADPAQMSQTRSTWITGEAAREHVQTLRHQNDAILVGVGTILADDPLLTDRSGLPRRRKLMRVILDSYLRIPLASRVVQTADRDVLVLCSFPNDAVKSALEQKGIHVLTIPAKQEKPEFGEILRQLGALEITSVMIEGGALVNGTAINSGEVDKIHLYFAPKIFGDGAVPFAGGLSLGGKSRTVKHLELQRFGDDFAVEGYLHDPYLD